MKPKYQQVNPDMLMPRERAIKLAMHCMRKEIARLRFELEQDIDGWRRRGEAERELNALRLAVKVLAAAPDWEDGEL